ncbi:hypothetical protein DER44DRAFT_401634 [Fusarium oxysporum]|nr:hypothetical protein DER44DRAFT_401634 [Fusarium oxysporum]
MTVLFELTCRRRSFSPMLSSTVWTVSLTGIVICPQAIATRVQEQLPFMCTESIVMKLVAKGVSRQEAHEQSAPYHTRVPVRVPVSSMTFLINRIKAEEFLRRSGLTLIPKVVCSNLSFTSAVGLKLWNTTVAQKAQQRKRSSHIGRYSEVINNGAQVMSHMKYRTIRLIDTMKKLNAN